MSSFATHTIVFLIFFVWTTAHANPIQEKLYEDLVNKRKEAYQDLALIQSMKASGKRITEGQITVKKKKIAQIEKHLTTLAKRLNRPIPGHEPAQNKINPEDLVDEPDASINAVSPLIADYPKPDPIINIKSESTLDIAIDLLGKLRSPPMIDISRLPPLQQKQYAAAIKKLKALDESLNNQRTLLLKEDPPVRLSVLKKLIMNREVEVHALDTLYLTSLKHPSTTPHPEKDNLMYGYPTIERQPQVQLKPEELLLNKTPDRRTHHQIKIRFAPSHIRWLARYQIDFIASEMNNRKHYRSVPLPYAQQHMRYMAPSPKPDFLLDFIGHKHANYQKIQGIVPVILIEEERVLIIPNPGKHGEEYTKATTKNPKNQWLADALNIQIKNQYQAKKDLRYELKIAMQDSHQRCRLARLYPFKKQRKQQLSFDQDGITMAFNIGTRRDAYLQLTIVLRFSIAELPFITQWESNR